MDIAYINIESEGYVIKAGEGIEIFAINEVPGIAAICTKYMRDLIIKIEYCSIYGKCWINEENEISEI